MRAHDGRRGQALLEFALVLPILIFILLIAIDFGRLFYTFVGVNNAAREAAFWASSNPRCATATNPCPGDENLLFYVRQEQSVTTTTGFSTTASCFDNAGVSSSSCSAGKFIRVSINEPFRFLTPFLTDGFATVWSGFGNGFTIGASAEAAIQ